MKQEQKKPVPIVYRMIQNTIRKERKEWPPGSHWGIYQPRRPNKPLAQHHLNKEEK